MEPVFVDLETFWSTTHSLSKMSPIAYCMHPETEIISLAAKFGAEGKTQVIFGEENIKDVCARIDWTDKFVVGHNLSGFDAMILAWRLGVRPKMWGCTMAMAAPHHAKAPGLSLAKLSQHYQLGVKDNAALVQTKGRHLEDFTAIEVAAMGEYNKEDVNLCYGLFRELFKKTPKSELLLIDMTIRMLVEPQFTVDRPLLEKTLEEERSRKQLMLLDLANMLGIYDAGMEAEEAANAVAKTLGSAAKFGQLLADLGVETPQKISPTTGKPAPALAKTDEGFLALQDHPDPIVSTAVAARLGVKSTLLETRIEAFIAASDAVEGLLPVPLKYYGADTTGRWSGWGYNPQNLPRVNPHKPKPADALRMALMAPKGHQVVVADLSGIELRVNHFLWKVPSSTALFQADPEKADLYKDFASRLYDVPVGEVTKDQRQVGKVSHLGLGFGAGPTTFRKVAKLMAGIDLDEAESRNVVYKWREEYPQIVNGWKLCHSALTAIANDAEYQVDPWGLCSTSAEGIITPKGVIRYPGLRLEIGDDGKKEWWYGEGRRKARIYAGKVVENVVQHLARNVIADNALDVWRKTQRRPALMVHDELVYIVPDDEAEDMLALVQSIMRTPPTWWPELVTWSEGSFARAYGMAK